MSRYRWIRIAILVVMILYAGFAVYAFFDPEFMNDVVRHAWWILSLPGLIVALNYTFFAFRRSRDRKRMNP
jgi:cytochrome bd-type quinol oxidase subunit 2